MVNFEIKTITPIHIGSGDYYNASEYFINANGKYSLFNRIDLTKYFNSLNKKNQNIFSKKLLNENFKLPKLPIDFIRYSSYNRCLSRPNPSNKIHENIKVMDKPYIPGSSIKGAIENALIYNSLNFNDIENMFSHGKINDNIIKKFFSPLGTPQNSIMRFLQISDSSLGNKPYIFDIQTIKVNKKGDFEVQMKLFFETIVTKGLSSSLTTNFDFNIYKPLNLENKTYLLDIDYIKESLYNFSNDYIDFEIEFSNQYNINKSEKFYRTLKRKNTIKNPLIRLGSTTGLLSSSIIFKIKLDYAKDYFNILKGIFHRKRQLEFPKTRRIINKSQHPTGWAQLSFKE